MKMIADICDCENTRDKILSVCQCGPAGGIEQEVIIQRGPKEYDQFDDEPGPKISCDALGLDIVPGPTDIVFSGSLMRIVLPDADDIEVDISGLDEQEVHRMKVVAEELFK